jgi:hypothetical protein
VSLPVTMSTSAQVLHMVLGLHVHVPLAGLAACLGFCTLTLFLWQALRQTQAGEEGIPTTEGSMVVFC